MAKKSKGAGKIKGSSKKRKKKGLVSTIDVRKTKSMEEVFGVIPINFFYSESLVEESKNEEFGEEEDLAMSDFIEANKAVVNSVQRGTISISPPVFRSGSVIGEKRVHSYGKED